MNEEDRPVPISSEQPVPTPAAVSLPHGEWNVEIVDADDKVLAASKKAVTGPTQVTLRITPAQ